MLQAIISDIHGNLPALKAVLADIKKRKPDEIICLGDVIGYGPQPRECLDLVRKTCSVVLMGNHEHAVLFGSEHFTPLAQEAIDWTANQLRDPETLNYLASLSPQHRDGKIMYVHGSMRDPLLDYLREADSPWMFHLLLESLLDDFDDTRVCFVGHNHRAFLGTEVGYLFPHYQPPDAKTKFNISGQKLYVSVGSVGQPRDSDYRSSYVLYDGENVEYFRIEYDVDATIKLIREANLPEFLAERLLYGE
ncbi:MAG: metallophosphoesterase [Planctomycetes bacterium]|nr:metallophosphoesterase [Planctomycetota bacterium]